LIEVGMSSQLRQAIRSLCRALLCTLVFTSVGRTHAQAGTTSYKDGVTLPPIPTHFIQAEYTQEARRAGFQGYCIVHLTIDERGIPQDVRVIRPIGMGLDENAIKAVKQERFKPATRGGRPVAFPLSLEVNFRPTP
jgi:TonB family protein